MSAVANVAINVDARNATAQLRQLQGQAGQTERAFGGLTAAVGKLAVAAAAIQAARFVFAKTAELETQTRSLQVLTGSAEKAKAIIQELQQLGAVTPFTSTELIDSAKRLQAFGVEANKVVETTKRLADVSGATGAELQGLVTAYGQVQAKGRLQGEELLQFQERGVALQEELRKMYGLSGEEFQKAMSKGQVSAEAVEVAVKRLTDTGGKYANGAIAQSDTLAGKFSTLQDGIDGVARQIGTALSPAIKVVLNEAIYAINAINDLLATGARARSFGLDQSQRSRLLQQANTEAEQIVNTRRIQNPFERNKVFLEIRRQRERDLIESYGYSTGQIRPQARTPSIGQQVGAIPPLLGAAGGASGRTGASSAESAAEKAAEEAKRLYQSGVELGVEMNRLLKLGQALTDDERERLEIQFQYRDRLKQIKGLKDKDQKTALQELATRLRDLDLQKLATKEIEKQNRLFYERAGFTPGELLGPGVGAFRTDINLDPLAAADPIAEYAQRLKDLMDPINQAKAGADAIGVAFSDAFTGLITGAQTTQEILANFFKGIADSFLQMATQMIAEMIKLYVFKQLLGLFGASAAPSGLFSGAGPVSGASVFGAGQGAFNPLSFGAGVAFRAMGGPVTAGQSYIVGERGPELFTPGIGGSISPNGGGSGGINVVVNVDAKGTQVQGSDQDGNQLGRALSAAVTAELIKQKRPGGLLA